ncbi:MAG: flagellar motor switch protein FliM [Desulfobulbaceae bacterium]|nr:flagellar motor switch protein FliM [Desulfobulbaceae bacterium]
MERILSKEEISELLAAVKHGEFPSDSGGDEETVVLDESGRSVSKLNLMRLPGLAGGKIPNLDIVMDSFARNLASSLSNRLQRSVNVQTIAIDYLQFEQALARLTPCGAIGVLDLDPLKAGGLLVIDEKLPFIVLEMQLGGGGSEVKTVEMNRALTTIETNLLKLVMLDSCADLKKSLSPIEEIAVSLIKIESNPRLVNIVAPEAGVVLIRFAVGIDDAAGTVALIIPCISLEPLAERMREAAVSSMPHRGSSWPEILQHGVCGLRANVSGQIAEISLRLRDLLNFQVGDVIELGCSQNSLVKVMVEGQHKFTGQVGVREGKKAVRISEIILERAEDGCN